MARAGGCASSKLRWPRSGGRHSPALGHQWRGTVPPQATLRVLGASGLLSPSSFPQPLPAAGTEAAVTAGRREMTSLRILRAEKALRGTSVPMAIQGWQELVLGSRWGCGRGLGVTGFPKERPHPAGTSQQSPWSE